MLIDITEVEAREVCCLMLRYVFDASDNTSRCTPDAMQIYTSVATKLQDALGITETPWRLILRCTNRRSKVCETAAVNSKSPAVDTLNTHILLAHLAVFLNAKLLSQRYTTSGSVTSAERTEEKQSKPPQRRYITTEPSRFSGVRLG